MDAAERQQLAIWHLKNCPLFSALDGRELSAVFEASRITSLQPDEIVPAPPDGEPGLWIVKRGHVKLGYVDQEGHQATVLILSPGDMFGSTAEAEADDYGEHCRTMTSACLCRISQSRFDSLMAKYPEVAYKITKSNFRRIHRLQARLADLMVRPAEARLALVLLDLDKQVGEATEDDGRVLNLPLSHLDLSQLIGTSREMVTHVMGRFRKAGWIATTRERITIKDRDSLEVARDVW